MFRFVDGLEEPKSYYRVTFFGSAFGHDLDGASFIYRFKTTVRLANCLEIVKQKVKELLGSADSAELLPGNAKTDNLDPSKCYIQVATVLPYWSRSESQRRLPSPALQNLGAMHFLQVIPFTKSGDKMFTENLDEQWMKKVIYVTSVHFSFAPDRIRVSYREIEDLSPIQVCESMIYDKVMSIQQELAQESQKRSPSLLMVLHGALSMPQDSGHWAIMKLFLHGNGPDKHNREHVLKLAETMKQFAQSLKFALDAVEAEAVKNSPELLALIEEIKKNYELFEKTLNSNLAMHHM